MVWITLLILCDTEGYVGAALPGIAQASGVTLEQAQDAMRRFQEPDPFSRTQTDEGRRVAVAERGFRVLNFMEHLDRLSAARKRARDRVWRHRERNKTKRDETPRRRQATTQRRQSSQGIGNREQGIGTNGSTETDSGAVAPAVAKNWEREAADDYREAYKADPPKMYFGQVKPVAKKYGWSRTRPALQAYMRETPIDYLKIPTVLPVRIEGGHSITTGSALAARPPTDKAKRRLEGMNAFIRGGLRNDGGGVDSGNARAANASLAGSGADHAGVPGRRLPQVPELPDGSPVAPCGERGNET